MRIKGAPILLLAILLTLSLAACGGTTGTGGSSQTISLGTSLPITGPLATFGTVLQLGYNRAISEVNASGGISINGTKEKVQLIVLDNKSDPNTASEQARTLFLKNGVVALLGSATPQLNIPISNVAEQLKRPVIQAVSPVEAWLGGRPAGWTYAWDIFFDENQSTNLEYGASDLLQTNKRVALFTDTEEDGITMGGIWEKKAANFGYTIAYHASFPVGTSDFSAQVAAAQAAHADVVIAQMLTPDAVALWKQMKSVGYQPKAAFCEKCGSTSVWPKLLGSLAEGAMNISVWSPTEGYPQANDFMTAYKNTYDVPDIGEIAFGYTVAKVTMAAIAKAQSLDAAAINSAVGQISGLYPVGQIHFGANHASATLAVENQWQNGHNMYVFPKITGANTIESPVPGLL